MTKQEIIQKVRELHLTDGSYIVFGSCPLAAVGIREANDIDLLVSEETLQKLIGDGWQKLAKGQNDNPYVRDVFEAHTKWNFSSYQPTLEGLLKTATVIEGVPFASLEEVRKWKVSSGRPKDFVDIELIDQPLVNKEK
jgi:hypothetical protein